MLFTLRLKLTYSSWYSLRDDAWNHLDIFFLSLIMKYSNLSQAKKANHNVTTTDSQQNSIQVKDVVKVIEGPFAVCLFILIMIYIFDLVVLG